MANIFPVRPNPDCTSSAMNNMPNALHRSSIASRNPAGAAVYPPSPSTGSMITAAVSPGAVTIVRRSSKPAIARSTSAAILVSGSSTRTSG